MKNGEAPIIIRVTLNGISEEIRVQRSVPPHLWDRRKGLSKGRDRAANELNEYIRELDSKVFMIYKDLVNQMAVITPALLLEKLFCKQENVRTVLKTFKEQIDEIYILIGIDYEKITWRRYDVCFRSLQEVVKREFKKEDISFYEFDRNVIRKLELYIKTERGLCENTIVRYMKCVKKLTNVALANEWLRKDPFIGLRYKEPETNPSYLTMEELSKIRDHKFNISRLNVVRDTFIFCCYTGLALSDAKELRPEHITTDNNGRLWIHKERIKMKRRTKKYVSSIPLMQTAIDLLDKYKDNPKCLSRGTCIPLYSKSIVTQFVVNNKATQRSPLLFII